MIDVIVLQEGEEPKDTRNFVLVEQIPALLFHLLTSVSKQKKRAQNHIPASFDLGQARKPRWPYYTFLVGGCRYGVAKKERKKEKKNTL